MFEDREDAALRLAAKFKDVSFKDPLVLAIPRGGVVTGAVLARELKAELDVVLSRKLGAPHQPELALGAVGEDGSMYLIPNYQHFPGVDAAYIAAARERQMEEIRRRQELFRAARPPADPMGRSVIVTDDGIATGATMLAALHVLRAKHPHELIVAVPVAPPERIHEVARQCDRVVCLLTPEYFMAVGQFYRDFRQVDDTEAVGLLRHYAKAPAVP